MVIPAIFPSVYDRDLWLNSDKLVHPKISQPPFLHRLCLPNIGRSYTLSGGLPLPLSGIFDAFA